MCPREPLVRHSGLADVSARLQECRLDGLGSTLYTTQIRNLTFAGSDFHHSVQVIFQANAWSQLVKAVCWSMATVQEQLFLHLCTDLALDKLSSLSPLSLVRAWSCVATKPSPTATEQTKMPCLSLA